MMDRKRRGKVPEHLKQPYVPEYQRLNRDPEQVVDPKFAANAPVRNFRVPNQKRGMNAPRRSSQGEFVSAASTVPKSNPMPVHVGNHDEQMWIDDERIISAPSQRNPNIEVVDNNDYVDVENLQGRNPFEEDPYLEEQPADDTSRWVNAHNATEQQRPQLNVRLTPGEYAVVFRNSTVCVSSDEKQIVAVIEDIIMNYDVLVDDIAVYKRQTIDFGAILK